MLGMGVDYVDVPHIPGVGSGQQFGGIAGYLSYVIDPHLTFNSRLEWYYDRSGFSTGAMGFGAINYYEATVGLAIKPFPNDRTLSHLLLRPELRYDHADHPVFDSGDRNQFSVAFDALVTF